MTRGPETSFATDGELRRAGGLGRMRLLEAELLASRQFLPSQWLQEYASPTIAAAARAGQFVHVRMPEQSGFVLRRPYTVNTVGRRSGSFTLHVAAAGRASESIARLRVGDRLEMLGPLGRPFEVDPRSRHLLLVAEGTGIAALRALVDEALESGRRVTLLLGARTAAEMYPSSLIPEEVEYLAATQDGSLGHHGSVLELVPEYEAWADQAFASGPEPMLAALAHLARGRDARLGVARLGRKGRTSGPALGSVTARRRAWLQVALRQTMGCAVGACLGCVVFGVDGPLRVCREGPTFAAEEIAWEEPA